MRDILVQFGATCILLFGIYFAWQEYSFYAFADTAVGTVTSEPTRYRTGGRRSRHYEYRFQYSYSVHGKSHFGSASSRSVPSQDFVVYYNRLDPQESRVVPLDHVLAAGFLVLGLVLCGILFKPWTWIKRGNNDGSEDESEDDVADRDGREDEEVDESLEIERPIPSVLNRNSLCHCGSGMRLKHCCGKLIG